MSFQYAIGGALALMGALIHGIAGESLVVTRLRTELLAPTRFGGPPMTKLMIRVTWHIVTLVFVLIGGAMIGCAPAAPSRTCEDVGWMAAIAFAGFGLLAMGLAMAQGPRAAFRALWRHPGPIVFLGVAGLAWWGAAS